MRKSELVLQCSAPVHDERSCVGEGSLAIAASQAFIDALPDAVLVLSTGKPLRFNRKLRELWKLADDCGVHRSGHALDAIAAQLVAPEALFKLLHAPCEESREGELLTSKDGRVIELRATALAQDTRIALFRDVTARAQREAALREAAEAAESAHNQNVAFLANMSHELRTPLNAVIGFSRVLELSAHGVLSQKQRTQLSHIANAGDRMLQLVNSLAELRGVAGRALALEPVDVASVAREVLDVARPSAEEKRIALSALVPVDVPRALGNHGALQQLLTQLLSNAIKFTPEGGRVQVRVELAERGIAIGVHDTGPGIAAADQPHLFSYFTEIGGKHAHGMKGSGMGLALVHALVRKQNGRVNVESEPGRGSAFRVVLGVAS